MAMPSSSADSHHPTAEAMEELGKITSTSSPAEAPMKRRRITRACDRCHKGGIKCRPSDNVLACVPCINFGVQCTYDRPAKRRGPRAKNRDSLGYETPSSSSHTLRAGRPLFGPVKSEAVGPNDGWHYTELASPEAIEALLNAFRRMCFPLHPVFHWPTFMGQVRQGLYRTDRAFFATVMSACAVASARIRDGAYTQLPNPPPLPQEAAVTDSETFYEAAVRAIPADLSVAYSFNYKRAKSLLSEVAIQYGHSRTFCAHLGDYLTMCGIDGFHNESRWPSGLTEIDIQERRRLFWQMYQMDVYAAVTWNGIVRHRESQCTVLYPAEVTDEEISATGLVLGSSTRPPWMKGWNFVSDLYRILEHASVRLRAGKTISPEEPSGPVSILFERERGPSTAEVMGVVSKIYDKLPQDFKGGKAMTGDIDEDQYGFQVSLGKLVYILAANIIVTLQTVKMVMAGTEQASVSQRCMIAGELLDALASVPTAYIHASSAPMLHHLAGVGHLLGSVIQSPLSQWTYLQVRNVLLAMVDLLASLEACSSTEGSSARLKAHIQRIDAYMTNAARERQGDKVYHNALPKEAWSNDPTQSLRTTYGPAASRDSPSASASHSMSKQPSRPDSAILAATNSSNIDPILQQASGEPLNLASLGQQHHPQTANLFDTWRPQDDVPPNQQFQLPESFFTDWPFDVGQGEAFDFLGAFQQASSGNGNGFPDPGQAGGGSGNGDRGGIQDILGVGMPDGFIGAGQLGGVLGSLGFSQASEGQGT